MVVYEANTVVFWGEIHWYLGGSYSVLAVVLVVLIVVVIVVAVFFFVVVVFLIIVVLGWFLVTCR